MDIDKVMDEFARAFAGKVRGAGDVPNVSALDRSRLDGSLESLAVVDAYLAKVRRTRARIDPQKWSNLVHWGGAYVGEVIRRLVPGGIVRWFTRDDYLRRQPAAGDLLPDDMGTKALLASRDGSFTLPLNKIIRFVSDGPEHSVDYYARAQVDEIQARCHADTPEGTGDRQGADRVRLG